MNALLLMVGIILFFVLLIPPMFRMVVKGKIYCIFIEDDGYVGGVLKKPMFNEEYILDKGGAYDIVPGRVGITVFPRMLPSFFQSIIPCIIYRRDNPIPQIIKNPIMGAKEMTSKEVKVGLESHFIKNLVATSREGIEKSRLDKMLPLLTIVGVLLSLVLILVVLYRTGAIEQGIKLIP